VVAEEFGEWEDSKRRIDLLGVDADANLVVIELKRSEDGGHMDLQAIRYSAMVSTMTFGKVVSVFSDYLKKQRRDEDPQTILLDFLKWDEPDEDGFADDVRIILVSAEFSIELTTAVLWLNERDLDIRCVRIKPYDDNGRVLVDVQQVIPLPEALEYQVQIKEKQQSERIARKSSKDLTKYDVVIAGQRHDNLPKRHAIFAIVKYLCDNGVSPAQIETASGMTRDLFQVVDGDVDTRTFLAQLDVDRHKRCFCDDGELIQHGGKTYAFTNQWGRRTKSVIDNLLKALPGGPGGKISITASSL
jgi:hypothetical protein